MSGCLHRIAAMVLFAAGGALVTHILPLGDPPRNANEERYVRNALEMRRFLNDHPISRGLDQLFVLRTTVAGLRQVPGSCGDAQPDIIGMEEVVATVTDHSIYGIPVARYQVSCAGNAITRGTTARASRKTLPPPEPGEPLETTITAPRAPPPPGVSPPPAP